MDVATIKWKGRRETEKGNAGELLGGNNIDGA